MRNNSERCLFCEKAIFKSGDRKNNTVEHVVPRWLQAHLHIEAEPIQLTLTSMETLKVVGQRSSHPLSNLVLGSICKKCNGGWMRDLENATAPFLRLLTKGELHFNELSQPELFLLARWAMKTACCFSAVGLESHIPKSHFASLKKAPTSLDSRVAVFARRQKATDKPFAIDFDRNWRGYPMLTTAAAGIVNERSYRFAMLFGELLLVVVCWPLHGWRYRIEADFLTPIWPATMDAKIYVHPSPVPSLSAEGLCLRAAIGTIVSWTPQARGAIDGTAISQK